jgi:hypothetical protein
MGGREGWPEAPGGEQAWLTTWLMLLPDIKAIYIYRLHIKLANPIYSFLHHAAAATGFTRNIQYTDRQGLLTNWLYYRFLLFQRSLGL